MTPDEIKKMTDEELNRAVVASQGWTSVGTENRYGHDISVGVPPGKMSTYKRSILPYSTDLNAAWPLQFGSDGLILDEWGDVLEAMIGEVCYPSDPRRCARLISEAFLYLKTKGE